MKIKDKIENHFIGITDEDIVEHKRVMAKVRKNTNSMLHYAAKKVREMR